MEFDSSEGRQVLSPGYFRPWFLLLAATLLLSACGPARGGPAGAGAAAPPSRVAVPPVSASGDVAAETIRLVNIQRARRGLGPLTADPKLTAAARFHAEYMAKNDCFDHTCRGGPTFIERIGKAGYPYRAAAENIAAGMASPAEIVEAWMTSKGHRANILNPDVDEAGVGYFLLDRDGGKERWRHYWAMTYGKKF